MERAVPDWSGFFYACNPVSELFHIRCQRVLTALNVTHSHGPDLYTLTMVGMGVEYLGQYQREARIVDALEGEEGGPESFSLQSGEEPAEELHLDDYGSCNHMYIQAGKEHPEGLTVRLFTLNGKQVYEHTFSALPAG